jgi:hypothetical protein
MVQEDEYTDGEVEICASVHFVHALFEMIISLFAQLRQSGDKELSKMRSK